METKWVCGRMPWWLNKDGEWQHDSPLYSSPSMIQQCYRILERLPIHTTDLDFIMETNDVYVHEDKKYTIERIEYNSDNTITYHTDCVVSNATIRSYEDVMKELCEQRELRKQSSQSLECDGVLEEKIQTTKASKKIIFILDLLLITLFLLVALGSLYSWSIVWDQLN